MSDLHPALAFLRNKLRAAQPIGSDSLALDVDGTRLEIVVAGANAGSVFFAEGNTRLAYRCAAVLSDAEKERLRGALREIRGWLTAARVEAPDCPLPEGGGWTEGFRGGESGAWRAWRDWVARSYRATVENGRRDECTGLPDCLDLRMRPPIPTLWAALTEAPPGGPCSRCGRARGCPHAHASDAATGPRPLRHAEAASAETAAMQALSEASAVPLAKVLEAHALLVRACSDRAVDGAMPFEYSVRLSDRGRGPDRVRFVSYYPLVAGDAVRREINRGRHAALRELAARWLTDRQAEPIEAWLACTARILPPTLGLSIGLEMNADDVRLQVYAHPEPDESARRFTVAAIEAVDGSADGVPETEGPPVLVGIAVAANRPPAIKVYYHRPWETRGDTGLLPEGLGELEPFNPGWGLAVREHVGGRGQWVKWDFPVTAHYQVCEPFLDAFWRFRGGSEAVPAWMRGERFSPWLTWASVGRGGRALYFHAR